MNFVAFRSRLVLLCGLGLTAVCACAMGQTPPQPPLGDSPDTTASQPASAPQEIPSIERAALSDLDAPNLDSLPSDDSTDHPRAVDATTYKPLRCDITSLGRCFKDLLADEAGMWTSPIRVRKRDLYWLLPLGAATAAALETDARVSKDIGFRTNQVRYSKDFSDIMEDAAWASAGGLYILGKITHNETARETGVLSVEAGIDATIVVEILKLATDRLRPDVAPNTGPFWQDSTYTTDGSFPSGHCIAVFAIAKVFSDETPGNVWLHIGLYLLAGATAVTRVTAQEHFPSDVIVGSALGYLIGGYVYRHHSAAGGREGMPVQILPFADASTHAAGLAISLDPSSLQLKSPQQMWTSFRDVFSRGAN
jgi:hypothetical protein